MTTSTVRAQKRATAVGRSVDLIPVAAFGVDLVTIGLAILVAVLGRDILPFPADVDARSLSHTLTLAGPLIVVGWLAVLALSGGYRRQLFGAGVDEYKLVARSALITTAALGISSYLTQFQLSRGFFTLLLVFGVPLTVAGRYVLRRGLHRARRRGSLQQLIVIAGTESHVDDIAGVLARERWLGYHVVGAVLPRPGQEMETSGGTPILGEASGLVDVVRTNKADIVFLAGGAFDSAQGLRRVAWALEHEDIQIVVAPSLTDVASERIRVRPVGGLPLIHLEKPRSAQASRWAKRTFDVIGSLSLLVVVSPILLVAGIAIALHDRGPVFFRQVRIGREGKPFSCWKLRTMVVDAEARLTGLHGEHGYAGGLFKLRQDPRVTPPGRWLRRYSIDELPQLMNVLRGDMSLVGPRPPLPHEVEQYDAAMHRRLHVRPGMTGLWQISGRSDLAWNEAIRLDLYYVDNWSMLQDLVILGRTVGAVLRRQGAY